jgi:hypothetical protein
MQGNTTDCLHRQASASLVSLALVTKTPTLKDWMECANCLWWFYLCMNQMRECLATACREEAKEWNCGNVNAVEAKHYK